MQKSIIYKVNLKNYLSVVWQNRPVWKYYLQLRTHLVRNLGEDAASIFAEPYISDLAAGGETESSWLSETVSKNAKRLSELPEAEQTRYQALLAYKVQKIEAYAQGLLAAVEPKEREWGELILKCLEIPDFSAVLVEGEQVVLVLWGFKVSSSPENFGLVKKMMGIQALRPVEELGLEPIQEELPILPEENNNIPLSNEEKEPIKEEPLSTENTAPKIEKTETPKVLVARSSDGFWSKYKFWLLGLLILLLLALYWFFNRSDNGHLPNQPGVIIPIDSSKIALDADSISSIATDRLNVALGGTDRNMQAFAKKFKSFYPSSDYKVIYYDTLTYRLQLQVPPDKREALKTELKSKMPEYNLLIWDEAMFQNNAKPSDPGFSNPRQSWHHEKIKAYGAWDVNKGSNDIVVAVIDDGFDLSHPELKSKVYKPWNVPARNANVTVSGRSEHGTHVAGIAAGLADNSLGVSGIALECKLMPIQVGDRYGRMSTTAIVDGILYAIHNGADVVNMSLGKMMAPQVAGLSEKRQEELALVLGKGEEAFWNQIFSMAEKAGVTVVLAGGNQNIIIGLDPMQRTPYTINVSATDPGDKKASFSNYGQRSTLSAPGVQIYSSVPGGRFAPLDGTSMAAPIVTGAIGLMKSVNPALTSGEIVDILQTTGIPLANRPYIGNLIQLDAAMEVVAKIRGKMPKVDCPDAQRQIDSLLQAVERIRRECDLSNGGDTLKFPPIWNKDGSFDFTKGRWKSTTSLYNKNSGERITIYFDFNKGGDGTITMEEQGSGKLCSGDVTLSNASGSLLIDQRGEALCSPPPGKYDPYSFECVPDASGCAECTARNKARTSNQFKFRLVRVNGI